MAPRKVWASSLLVPTNWPGRRLPRTKRSEVSICPTLPCEAVERPPAPVPPNVRLPALAPLPTVRLPNRPDDVELRGICCPQATVWLPNTLRMTAIAAGIWLRMAIPPRVGPIYVYRTQKGGNCQYSKRENGPAEDFRSRTGQNLARIRPILPRGTVFLTTFGRRGHAARTAENVATAVAAWPRRLNFHPQIVFRNGNH